MKNLSEGRAAKKKMTVFIGRVDNLEGERIRGNQPTGQIETMGGFYDILAVREGEILLAVNFSESGSQFDPSNGQRFLIKNNRRNQRILRKGINKVVKALIGA